MNSHSGSAKGEEGSGSFSLSTAVIAIAFAFACMGLSAQASQNLLVNPGFEEGATAPVGWDCFPPNPPGINYIWDAGFAHGGVRSVSVLATGSAFGMWQQVVPVTPGAVYRLSGFVAFEDIVPPGCCNLQLVFRNGANQIIEMVNYPHHDGTREFALDFPPELKVRAPAGAAAAEVNLYLQGPGRAWFDDVLFSLAPAGAIAGTVTSGSAPLPGARVFIWGDPWGAVIEDFTNAAGHYELPEVPVAFPRYVLIAEKPGYKTRPAGEVIVSAGDTTIVDFHLPPGLDPLDDLRIKCGRVELALWSAPPDIPDNAVIPPDANGYPPHIRPYLVPDEYVESDHPAVIAQANAILASVPPELRTNAVAVAHAIYEWVSKNVEHDGVFSDFPGGLNQPYRDVTSGIWQTISGQGWCWGRSFYDWAYRSSESLAVRGTICVEHAWLDCALLRALNIPARAAIGSNQFWVQPLAGPGTWISMSTTAGRTGYREHGQLGGGFGTSPQGSFYPVANRPLLHEDWNAQNPGLWREVHPWNENYAGTPAGLTQALLDLEHFAQTGNAPQGTPPPPGSDRYSILYSDITLNLCNLGNQRFLEARFPLASASATHVPLTNAAHWTNHPECVVGTWMEVVTNPPVEGEERWYHVEFDLAPLLGLGDLNCDGVVNAFDIDAFVVAMVNPAAYPAMYPGCDRSRADVNRDGHINGFDLDPFVDLLVAD